MSVLRPLKLRSINAIDWMSRKFTCQARLSSLELEDATIQLEILLPGRVLCGRHFELELKYLIELGRGLMPPLNPVRSGGRGHDLLALRADARKVLTTVFAKDDPSALDFIDHRVVEMSMIDPGGQHLLHAGSQGQSKLADRTGHQSSPALKGDERNLCSFVGCSMGLCEFVHAQQNGAN